jgi:hypothetical protein
MKMRAGWLVAAVAAVVAAGAGSLTARGEDALDLGLGPKAGPEVRKVEGADEVKPKGEVKKEEAVAPVGGELISPEAAKTVDDEDLVKKLTGEAKPGDKFKEVIGRMEESATRLKEKDTGSVTQETQRRIVMDLDVLIEMAKKMQQQSSSSQQPGQQKGQQKQQSEGNQQGPHAEGGSKAAEQSTLPGGGASAASSNGSDIREKSTEWGGLPARDRDLVSHGANEQYLPAYQDQIRKYYESLAEIGKAAKEK